MNVPGRTVYWDLSCTWETWVSKSGSPIGEIHVACAMVTNRCKNVLVRVINPANYPITSAIETVLTELGAVQAVDNVEAVSEAHSKVVPEELGDRDAFAE